MIITVELPIVTKIPEKIRIITLQPVQEAEIIQEWSGYMKTSKKIFLLVSGCCLVIFFVLGVVNHALSKPDYAQLYLTSENDETVPYVILNDSQKYRYLMYYSQSEPDLTIRNGKNMFLSKFRRSFGAYSDDPERNFLYNNEGDFGFEVVGLYAKESALDDLFKPTPENISHVEICKSSDFDDVFSFRAEDAELFDYFLKAYSDELSDYFYPTNVDDLDVFNEEYRIDVFYQNDKISRFLKRINQSEFQILYSMSKQ